MCGRGLVKTWNGVAHVFSFRLPALANHAAARGLDPVPPAGTASARRRRNCAAGHARLRILTRCTESQPTGRAWMCGGLWWLNSDSAKFVNSVGDGTAADGGRQGARGRPPPALPRGARADSGRPGRRAGHLAQLREPAGVQPAPHDRRRAAPAGQRLRRRPAAVLGRGRRPARGSAPRRADRPVGGRPHLHDRDPGAGRGHARRRPLRHGAAPPLPAWPRRQRDDHDPHRRQRGRVLRRPAPDGLRGGAGAVLRPAELLPGPGPGRRADRRRGRPGDRERGPGDHRAAGPPARHPGDRPARRRGGRQAAL